MNRNSNVVKLYGNGFAKKSIVSVVV